MSEPSQDMALLVASVDLGGFSAAAQQFDRTPSAVSKAMTRLEERLGVRLLYRTTRRLALTPEGELYYHRAKHILGEIQEIESTITQGATQPRGLLRISVGVAFGMHQLIPAIPEFRARFPQLELAIDVSDRLVDLLQDHTDVAIRNAQLRDSTLVARKISETFRTICAAPSYLKRRGEPTTPHDLLGHDCLGLMDSPHLSRWPFITPGQAQVDLLHVPTPVTASSADALLQMAIDGVGIIRLGDVIAGPAIRAGALVPLLVDQHQSEPLPINAVMPPGRQRSAKTRVFLDFLIEKFAHAPWRHHQ
jgi:DNA-binding transcriptional LysR family regulator